MVRVISTKELKAAARESLGLSIDNWDTPLGCDLERVEEMMPTSVALAIQRQIEKLPPVQFVRKTVTGGGRRRKK